MCDQSQPSQTQQSAVRRATRSERIAAAFLALGCLSVLFIAAWLHADPDGHGTHTQLGLSECGWAAYFDAPCATCGMTTSFTHAADGQWATAISTQPFGAALALIAATLFWGGLHTAATGSRLGTAAGPLLSSRLLTIAVGMFLIAWAYKWVTW